MPENDAKELLFYSMFGSQVVGLFCSSLMTVFYPRLVAAKLTIAHFRFVLRSGIAINIAVGLAALAALYVSLPLLNYIKIVSVPLLHKQSLIWFSVSQVFLAASTMAQMPCILFSRGQLRAALIYASCTLIYVLAAYLSVRNGYYYSISSLKAAAMFIMFTLLLVHAIHIVRQAELERK